MAGDFGGEGVFLQGLANGLRTSAAYTAGKFAVGYGLPGRDCQEFQIDFLLELGDFFAGYDSVAEGWHRFVGSLWIYGGDDCNVQIIYVSSHWIFKRYDWRCSPKLICKECLRYLQYQ